MLLFDGVCKAERYLCLPNPAETYNGHLRTVLFYEKFAFECVELDYPTGKSSILEEG